MSLGKVFATTTVSSAVIVMGLLASGVHGADAVGKQGAAKAAAVTTVPGMPPVPNPANLYSETGADHIAPAVRDDLERIYVPNLRSNDVYVIDPAKMKVVDKFKVGPAPQHVVPSWDLRTLWVANNAERRTDGSLTPIDPRTGKPGKEILVDDPYNVYATPDGASLIVVAEAKILTTEIAILATNKLHELGGTRSTLAQYNLDRHWRNARTHTLHDPVRWKYFHVGNYALNGISPPSHAWS